ncbi:histidine phosphatase family protein [Paracoccus sphaerophysae]|uniref:histidine phosphatase family protein n=1 Tax=Paracoccus sphaerophysae TaxID=690417 RepID=UPI00235427B1|nr:histidine phosphatase family protein [Paracoccus sphaerophysae]
MQQFATNELVLIRHAPADHGGRLIGRTDVPASMPGPDRMARARGSVGACRRVFCSPARRCTMTAQALFPGLTCTADPRLWEQDFGQHDGMPATDLPDLGPLDRAALAGLRNPGGESFADLARRVAPAIKEIAAQAAAGPIAVVAHAGTIRAALSMALGRVEAGLAFDIAPLSATRLAWHGGDFAILATNHPLA